MHALRASPISGGRVQVFVVALLGAFVAYAGVAASLQKRSGPKFEYVRGIENLTAIPGTPLFGATESGSKRKIRQELWINRGGGGRSELALVEGGGCTLQEALVVYSMFAQNTCGFRESSSTLLDRRLIPGKVDGPDDGFLFSGHRIDNLKGKSGAIERAVTERARDIRRSQPDALPRARRFEVIIDIMRSPLAHRSTRRHLARLMTSVTGAETREAVDPRGRAAVGVTIADQSRVDKVNIAGTTYELAGALDLSQEFFFDPTSFEPLGRRVVLNSTTLPELEPWVESQASAGVVREASYTRSKRVKNRRLRQVRRPCEKLGSPDAGGTCIDIGTRGGRYIVTSR